MRRVESLLLLANLLTFLTLAIPPFHSVIWMRYLAPVALVIVIVQVLAEGPRWQLVPAYALAVLFFLIWLLGVAVSDGMDVNRFIAGSGIGLGVLGIAVSTLLPVALPVFHFPKPTGPYAIGTTTYHWVDTSRAERFTTNPGVHRELMAQIWYPARKGSRSSRAPYIRDSDAVAAAVARIHNFPGFSLQQLRYVTAHASESAPIADDEPSYPVLMFVEGLTGYRQMSTFQVEELVSHGYIVVGVDQPGSAAVVVFPDGRQVAGLSKAQMDPLTWQSISPAEEAPLLNGQPLTDGPIPYFAQDVSFTLDRLAGINGADANGILTGKLDLQRAGVFGVSFGGIVGAEACLTEPHRLKACLVMDVFMSANVVQAGLTQAGMWITRPADTMLLERRKSGGWTDRDIEETQATMRSVYASLPGDGYFVQVPGMFHIDFTDVPYASPIFPRVGFSGPIGVQRAHDIVNAYSVAFFDQHLKGRPSPLLDASSKRSADVLFETRRPQSEPVFNL